jgi:HK97 family phage major capsid protein
MDIQAQIKAQQEAREAKFKQLEAVHEKAATENRVFTEAEQKEFDAIKGDIAEIDGHLKRLQEMEALSAARATKIVGTVATEKGEEIAARGGVESADFQEGHSSAAEVADNARIKGAVDNLKALKPGVLFARVAIAKAVGKQNGISPELAAQYRWGDVMGQVMRSLSIREMQGGMDLRYKADVPVDEATTGFIELLRAASIITRLPMRQMSFGGAEGIRIPRQNAGTIAGYVGQAGSIKASKMGFDAIQLYPYKLACLVPVSSELLRRSNPDIDMLVRDDLVSSAATVADLQYLTGVATPGVAPGGITLNLPASNTRAATMAGAAPTVDEVTQDLAFLIGALRNANIPMAAPGWIMSERTRTFLMMQRDVNDRFAWRDEIVAGTLLGFPIVSSTTVPIDLGTGTDESLIVLADFNQIIFAQGQLPTVDASTEATIQSDDSPSTPPDLTTSAFSAFQQDSMILRLRMEHDWQKRQELCLATLTAVKY